MDSVQGYEKQGSPLASNGIAKANPSIPVSTPIPKIILLMNPKFH